MHDSTPEHLSVDRFEWERSLRRCDVTGNALLVLLVLATHMDRDGTNGRPSQATLATETGLSARTVRRHLSDACSAGWLTQVSRGHRRGDGHGVASNYSTSQPVTTDRLSDDSTGHPLPVEDYLYRSDAASQPDKSTVSTGHPWPPTKPLDQEENKARPEISDTHKAFAVDALRSIRNGVRA